MKIENDNITMTEKEVKDILIDFVKDILIDFVWTNGEQNLHISVGCFAIYIASYVRRIFKNRTENDINMTEKELTDILIDFVEENKDQFSNINTKHLKIYIKYYIYEIFKSEIKK